MLKIFTVGALYTRSGTAGRDFNCPHVIRNFNSSSAHRQEQRAAIFAGWLQQPPYLSSHRLHRLRSSFAVLVSHHSTLQFARPIQRRLLMHTEETGVSNGP